MSEQLEAARSGNDPINSKYVFERRFRLTGWCLYLLVAFLVSFQTRSIVVTERILLPDITKTETYFAFGLFFWNVILSVFVVYPILGWMAPGVFKVVSLFTGTAAKSEGKSYRELVPHLQTFLVIAAKLCRSDGPVSTREIKLLDHTFINEMQLTPPQLAEARQIFREGKDAAVDIGQLCQIIIDQLGKEQELLHSYAHFLFQLATADGPLLPNEKKFLHTAFSAFGYDSRWINQVLNEAHADGDDYQSNSGNSRMSRKEAMRLLDVENDFTASQLRSLYMKKVKEFHPDRLVGLSLGLRKLAEEQLKRINHAYEILKRGNL